MLRVSWHFLVKLKTLGIFYKYLSDYYTLISTILIECNESKNNTIERKIVKKDVEIEDDIVTIWLNDEEHITNIPLLA